MNVAILSESSADEAALRILIEGILGRNTQPIAPPRLRARGWPFVLQILPVALKYLHYHTDAEAFVLVVDSNHSIVHQNAHGRPGGVDPQCRLCQLQAAVARVRGELRPVSGRLPIKTAIGLAVLAIEAWYRCGLDPQVTEAAWTRGLQSKTSPYTKNKLKQDVYGTDRPPLELETSRAVRQASRLVQNLLFLEQSFPDGFGSLAREVRSWVTDSS
jgi:hypothetical protein